VVLTDPSAFEEPLLQSNASIALFPDGRICAALQVGGVGREDAILLCMDAAAARLPVLQEVLEQTQRSLA
jgi:exosome complex RNA-binding protein Rrp42 (RNase PH superfamily)